MLPDDGAAQNNGTPPRHRSSPPLGAAFLSSPLRRLFEPGKLQKIIDRCRLELMVALRTIPDEVNPVLLRLGPEWRLHWRLAARA